MAIIGYHYPLYHARCGWPQFSYSQMLTDICVVYSFWLLWILWVYLSCPKPRLGGLKNRHLFFHSLGGWKSQAKVPTVLFSGEDSSWIAALCLLSVSSWTHMASSMCLETSGVFSASYKDTRPIGLGSHSDDLRTLKVLSPNMITLGVRALVYETSEYIIASIMWK